MFTSILVEADPSSLLVAYWLERWCRNLVAQLQILVVSKDSACTINIEDAANHIQSVIYMHLLMLEIFIQV